MGALAEALGSQSSGMMTPSSGMTGPSPMMTGTVPGIENLPTNFGGAKPMDYMMPKPLDPAFGKPQGPLGLMGPMGPLSDPFNPQGSFMPSPISAPKFMPPKDLVAQATGPRGSTKSGDLASQKGAKAREEMLDQLNKNMKFQELDLTSSIRRRR